MQYRYDFETLAGRAATLFAAVTLATVTFLATLLVLAS
jgi:hypothetical protein